MKYMHVKIEAVVVIEEDEDAFEDFDAEFGIAFPGSIVLRNDLAIPPDGERVEGVKCTDCGLADDVRPVHYGGREYHPVCATCRERS